MADNNERIVVVLDLLDNLTSKIDKVMKQNAKILEKVNKPAEKIKKTFDKVDKKQKDLKRSTLGAMFAFRKIGETLQNLFKPAADALGIFDIWNTMLTLLFLPVLLMLLQPMIDIMVWFMNLPEPVKLVIGIVTGLVAVFTLLSVAVVTLTIAFGALDTVALPWILIAGVIIGLAILVSKAFITIVQYIQVLIAWLPALGKVFVDAWNWIKSKWEGAKEFFANLFNGIYEKITGAWKGVKDFFSNLWTAIGTAASTALEVIKSTVKGVLNFIISGLNSVISIVNKIKNIGGIGSKLGIPDIPEIPKLANGGIVTSPTTALIGERGPEAVIPLSKMGSMGTTINQYNTINVVDKSWVMQIIDENNRKLMAEIRRNSV